MSLKKPYRWHLFAFRRRFVLLAILGLLLVCGFHLPAIATSVLPADAKEKLVVIQPKQGFPPQNSFPNPNATPHRQPRISIQYSFYPIQGTSTDELNRQMIQNAPFRHSPGLSDFAAITQWNVRWTFGYQTRGKQCILINPSVNADIKIVLPTLKVPTPLAVRKEWFRYIQALKAHEDGHKNNGIAAANDIQTWMELFGPAESCQALVKNVSAVAQKMVEQYHRNDQAYDRLTDHGLTQGAILNRVNS